MYSPIGGDARTSGTGIQITLKNMENGFYRHGAGDYTFEIWDSSGNYVSGWNGKLFLQFF